MKALNKKWLALPIIALIAAAGYGVWGYSKSKASQGTSIATEAETEAEHAFDDSEHDLQAWAEAGQSAPLEGPQSTAQSAQTAQAEQSAQTISKNVVLSDIVVDGSSPTAARTIGSIDAPVTIIDYSSLTCPHCASAHTNVMPHIIEDYVKAGKVRVIFNDFPLNQQALDASKVARCVANDQYFGFLSMLFGSIEQWGYSNNHPEGLINTATLTGLSAERARECLEDSEIEEAILKDVQSGISLYQISSTPTFVINNGAQVIRGAQNYAAFQRAIEDELAKKQKK